MECESGSRIQGKDQNGIDGSILYNLTASRSVCRGTASCIEYREMYSFKQGSLSSHLFLVDNHGVQVESLSPLLLNLLDDGAEVRVVLVIM